MYEKEKKELLKQARNAFEIACTLHENERVEVYLDNGEAKMTNVLDENEEIVYTHTKLLCYQVYGHNYLEDEIKTWIDYARVIQTPLEGEVLPEPTDVEKSIRELIEVLAKQNGVPIENVSSYEVFANLSMTLLGTIEQEIIEYWWSANEEENAKTLASAQINSALEGLKSLPN
ncbi:MAG: hypothetical protein JXQ67_07585 [Campylobacterales bacterium]|nr:hypothetical protein [Campylobacterales bacterium]